MGWERKRGKIEEFNRLLRGATDTSFVDPGRRRSTCCRRSATASRSTPTRGCRATPRAQLIGIIAHPLQPAARSTRALGRVTEGYGILQPRVSVTMASAAGLAVRAHSTPATPASIRTRPRCPTPTRTCSAKASSPARASTTSTRSPPRSRAACRRTRCCRTTCSKGCTRAPRWSPTSSWSTTTRRACSPHARRQHRWVRGDWQILCWLFPFVPTRAGLKRNRLPLIARWKILDNLRRSLRGAGAAAAARRRLDGAARAPAGVDGGRRWRRWRSPLLSRVLAAARAGRARGAVVRACSCAPCVDDLQTALAQRRACSSTFLAYQACETAARDRRHAGAPRRHAAPAARVGDGGRERGARRGRRGAAARVLRARWWPARSSPPSTLAADRGRAAGGAAGRPLPFLAAVDCRAA